MAEPALKQDSGPTLGASSGLVRPDQHREDGAPKPERNRAGCGSSSGGRDKPGETGAREPEHVGAILDRVLYGIEEHRELLTNASLWHSRKPCFEHANAEPCGPDGTCLRHRTNDIVADASVAVQAALEAALERANLVTDEELGRILVEDILDNVRRALGVRS